MGSLDSVLSFGQGGGVGEGMGGSISLPLSLCVCGYHRAFCVFTFLDGQYEHTAIAADITMCFVEVDFKSTSGFLANVCGRMPASGSPAALRTSSILL